MAPLATLRCKIGSLPFLGLHPHSLLPGTIQGKEGIKFCHLATLFLSVSLNLTMEISPMHLQGEIVGPVVSVRDDDFTGDAVSVVDPAAPSAPTAVKAQKAAAAMVSPRLHVPTSVPTIVPGVSPPPGSAGRAHQVGSSPRTMDAFYSVVPTQSVIKFI